MDVLPQNSYSYFIDFLDLFTILSVIEGSLYYFPPTRNEFFLACQGVWEGGGDTAQEGDPTPSRDHVMYERECN